jgi:hypothetical protein
MQAITNTLRTVPTYVLFIAGMGSVLALGLFKLYGMLQSMGLGQ